MPTIDITTMLGMKPRIEPFLLPDECGVLAKDCHFDSGVISPLNDDALKSVTFPITPKTIFHYRDNFWFSWSGDVDVIRSPVAQDDYGRVYYTDGDYPKVTMANIATSGAIRPTAYFRLGVPAPSTVVSVVGVTPPSGTTDGSSTDDETRYYIQTFVSATGEEGPPSGVSVETNIAIPDSSVTLGFSPPQSNNNNITLRRVYRSATSDSSSGWYQVAELAVAVSSFVDSLTDDQLGATLATEDYLPPPSDMRGLCLMANGIASGFSGNTVLFSGAYLPYAWPNANRLTTEDDVVAICPAGTSLVVGTKGYPYVMTGVSPSSITSQKLNVQQACISKRSMVSVDGVVLYASPDGLVGVTESGASVATDKIISREQWQAMSPSTLRAWSYEGKYIGLTDTTGFIYDPQTGDFRELSNRWDAAYNDMTADALYLAKGTALYSWRGGSESNVEFRWRSKEFIENQGTSFSSCRIVSDDISKIGMMLFIDGVQELDLSASILPDGAFRLPAFRGYKWQIEVRGNAKVERITLATSMQEMSGG